MWLPGLAIATAMQQRTYKVSHKVWLTVASKYTLSHYIPQSCIPLCNKTVYTTLQQNLAVLLHNKASQVWLDTTLQQTHCSIATTVDSWQALGRQPRTCTNHAIKIDLIATIEVTFCDAGQFLLRGSRTAIATGSCSFLLAMLCLYHDHGNNGMFIQEVGVAALQQALFTSEPVYFFQSEKQVLHVCTPRIVSHQSVY